MVSLLSLYPPLVSVQCGRGDCQSMQLKCFSPVRMNQKTSIEVSGEPTLTTIENEMI